MKQKKAKALVEHEEKEIEQAKKKNAKEKADRLRHANQRAVTPPPVVLQNGVEVGKKRYGSN